MKKFQHFPLKILKKIEDFRKFSIFRFFENLGKFFHLKNMFLEKIVFTDITSSDLNEFWNGQKILKVHRL